MSWKEVGVPSSKEIAEAKAKGFDKCADCTALRPLMDSVCFRCTADHRLNKNQEFSMEVYK